MDVQLAFYRTAHAYKGGTDALGPLMGISGAVLRNKANPNQSSNKPMLSEADLMMGITGDYLILHTLAANHGHVCHKVDESKDHGDLAILELVTGLMASHGKVGQAVTETLADGRVDRHELERVKTKAYECIQQLSKMVSRLESML
ncbi:MAG: phage regulatory CII family protein [Paraperlucidibaca sp.]|nr:phage regulatory CII family protein [Paraperlucidibaca sp.]MBQ0722303.1 phage regulatory CII family protein [Paraperlucidibaca sp.]